MSQPSLANDYEAAVRSAVWFDRSAQTKIEAAGPEARAFLGNLTTQDIKKLPLHASGEAFLTTNKARVVAHVWISSRTDETLFIDAAPGLAERILSHLNHYLISEQVELADRTAEFAMFRVVGPEAGAIVGGTDLGPMQLRNVGELGWIRRQNLLALDAFDWFCPIANAEAVRAKLAGIAQGTPATYETLRIEAGLPAAGAEYDEQRFAMEIDRTQQAICYTKGCFLGQETIVMARDRGQLNRALRGIILTDADVPAIGTSVQHGADAVGVVTSATFSPNLGCAIALAYLRRGAWDTGMDVTIGGRRGTVSALPMRR